MKSRTSLFLNLGMRVALGLTLLLGLCFALGVQARPAHAQTTITVSTCDQSHLDAAITQASNDNDGDTINFSCSGDIKLTQLLVINGNMTIDGSGQNVTLDGQSQIEVMAVSSRVPAINFTLNDVTMTNGTGYGAGLHNYGGTARISNSTFSNNSASGAAGGGIYNDASGTITISNSTFINNTSSLSGGGILNGSGTMTITDSTFDNNTSNTAGGGLFNSGTLSITNSTFANNSVNDGGSGGAIANGSSSTVTIASSTIANNQSSSSGGGIENEGTVLVSGTIVANNTQQNGGNCDNFSGGSGSISDLGQGYNLDSDSSCFSGSNDLHTDPKLDPAGLQNNGGPTQTIALLSESPAIDYVPSSSCIDAQDHPLTTDQRGFPRPDTDVSENSCDIGAYESNYLSSDNDLQLTNMPGPITTKATSSSGAVVTYTLPTVVDGDDSSVPAASCNPAPNSTFAIGATTVTCSATDPDDSPPTVSKTFTVTVNPLLTVNIPKMSATEGHALNKVIATGKFIGTTSSLSATINWGDNTAPTVLNVTANSGTYSVKTSHTYAEEGNYPLSVTLDDSSDNFSVQKSSTVTVADAALALRSIATTINGKTLILKGGFSDADPGALIGDYTATIDWGDNSTPSAATLSPGGKSTIFTYQGKHTYTSHGTYTVTLTINDAGGSTITTTTSVTV